MKTNYVNLISVEVLAWILCTLLPFLVFHNNMYLFYCAQIFCFLIGLFVSQYLYYMVVKLKLHINNPVKKSIKHPYMVLYLFFLAILFNIVMIYFAIYKGKYYMVMLQMTTAYVFSKYAFLILLIYHEGKTGDGKLNLNG
jgi:hypothetical protein